VLVSFSHAGPKDGKRRCEDCVLGHTFPTYKLVAQITIHWAGYCPLHL